MRYPWKVRRGWVMRSSLLRGTRHLLQVLVECLPTDPKLAGCLRLADTGREPLVQLRNRRLRSGATHETMKVLK